MREKKVVVLGAGLVGRAIAVDLQKKYHTVAVDINRDALRALNTDYGFKTIHADISEEEKWHHLYSCTCLPIPVVYDECEKRCCTASTLPLCVFKAVTVLIKSCKG